MEADKCISTSSPATVKNQMTINDLDDYSLGMIFNKLPYIDRTHIKSVCQRWYAVSKVNWCTYLKCLIIDKNFFPSCDNTTENESILLEKILQREGPYVEGIMFNPNDSFFYYLPMGTIKRIAELCPKLKRLNTGFLMLNDDDWLACSNLEAFSFFLFQEKHGLGVLLHNNKRLRRLQIFICDSLTASDFDHLDPGQLEFLHIEYCYNFDFTARVADKLAESLVELKYSAPGNKRLNLQHIGKLKNLRSLSLKSSMERLATEFIADVARNCRKIERLCLAIRSDDAYDENGFEPLFDLPYLKRLVIIVEDSKFPREKRDRLVERAAHLEFFLIEIC